MNDVGDRSEFDVVVVGAGMAGLYLLKRLRDAGRSAVAIETADDVGGTWYWNRYPGARCDVESLDYSYSWDPELDDEWEWSERYATQPEILRYLQYVADKHDLRRDIRFETRVAGAEWDDDSERWTITTEDGDEFVAQHYVMASGCLSVPKDADIPGADRFEGDDLLHRTLAARGRRLHGQAGGRDRHRVIGDPVDPDHRRARPNNSRCSSGRPNFSLPAHNGPVDPEKRATYDADPAAYREAAALVACRRTARPTDGRRARRIGGRAAGAAFERGWEQGGLFGISRTFTDLGASLAANELASEFIRSKIRDIVDDPNTAEVLCPKDYPFTTKRPCVDSGYFATYNLPHVRLVNLRENPIETITEHGIDITGRGRHRVVGVRRDRVRDRLRCDDRTDRRGGHRGTRRPHAEGEVGRRSAHLPRPHRRSGSRTCS